LHAGYVGVAEVRIPDEAKLPADVEAATLRTWLDLLIVRLRRAAMP
jgi:hypothetical protein